MSSPRPASERDVHETTIAALPWLLSGRLDEAQAAPLRAHLAECTRCRDWQQFDQSLATALQDERNVDVAPHAAYARFAGKLEAHEARRWRGLSWIFRSTVAIGTPTAERSRVLHFVVAAQTAVIVLLAAGLALQASRTPPTYRTLSSPPAEAHTGRAIRLVVDDATTTGNLRDTLRRFDARIVAGPSELGVLTIEIGDPGQSADTLAIARQLREEPGVLFAEPVATESP